MEPEQEQEKGARVSYLNDGRGSHMDLKHLFRAGLLLSWVDSELCNEQEREQDRGRSRR